MKKLLLSVAALMVATLLFSQDDNSDVEKEEISQSNAVVLIDDSNLSS